MNDRSDHPTGSRAMVRALVWSNGLLLGVLLERVRPGELRVWVGLKTSDRQRDSESLRPLVTRSHAAFRETWDPRHYRQAVENALGGLPDGLVILEPVGRWSRTVRYSVLVLGWVLLNLSPPLIARVWQPAEPAI